MNTLKASDQKHVSLKRHRGVVLFLSLFAIGVGCFFLWRFLERPNIGTIYPGKLPAVPESFAQNKEKKQYTGKYIDFSYPALYFEKRHELPVNGPVKESVFLSANDVEGRKIALVVADRGTSDFMSDPSFQMRMKASSGYASSPLTDLPFQGILFEKNEAPFEVTSFFILQGLIVSVSVTSPFSIEGLKQELLTLLAGLHWRE